MKKNIKLLLFIIMAYFSYELMVVGSYYVLNEFVPKKLMADTSFVDTVSCLMIMVIYILILKYMRVEKQNTKKDIKIFSELKEKLIYIFVIAFGAGGISNLWLFLVDKYLYKIDFIGKSYKFMNETFSDMESGAFIYVLLSVAIVGPIVEELLFRGILYNLFSKMFKKPIAVILATGILFGIWHGIFVQTVYTTVCGVIFALVYYQTGSLIYPMIMHIINNSLSALTSIDFMKDILYYFDIIGFCMILPMIYILYKKQKDQKKIIKENN